MTTTMVPGQLVYWKEKAVIILELKGFSEAIVRTVENGSSELVRVCDLLPTLNSNQAENGRVQHLLAKEKEWELALERYEVILPLLGMKNRTSNDVLDAAKKSGKGITTVYRWLKRFEETGLVSSLLRQPREDLGESKLDKEVDELIETQIQQYYLRQERPTVLKLFRIIKAECIKADLPVPHKNTVYARVHALSERDTLRKRISPKIAKQKYEPLRGSFPGADYPNAVVQIDHTPVDLIIVDEEHRLPIGRPYLTISIDVATKMISGFKMTLDPPGASSAGLCIAHAILTKDNWLAKRDLDAEWPIYGKMQKIHVDNAKEFRGKMLEKACQQHGIILEFRPKGQPNYGPHVERAFRTFMQEVQDIPGTTFSNVKEKFEYDSEGKACITLSELELWFTVFIIYYYHHKPHRGISNLAPIKAYKDAIFGTKDKPGIGLPAPVTDEKTLQLDFTPYVERTIQRHGVVIDNVHYYGDSLRKWVASSDKNDRSKARKFIFVRDPRDISVIYFLDPDTENYIPISYLNTSRPSISLWELRAVSKKIIKENKDNINEDMIFRGIEKMREIERDAIEKTRLSKQQRATEKRKRRMAERRTHWQDVHNVTKSTQVEEAEDDMNDDIKPFSDIE